METEHRCWAHARPICRIKSAHHEFLPDGAEVRLQHRPDPRGNAGKHLSDLRVRIGANDRLDGLVVGNVRRKVFVVSLLYAHG
jgi:hypothetical protein